jgi:hypothetical protein
MVEAVIIYKLPVRLSTAIGRVITAYAVLEYKLSGCIAVILQLQKQEWRLVLKEPRASERLEAIEGLLAIRDITIDVDFVALRDLLDTANRERDQLAHGIWLRHPQTRKLYLRLTKGSWKKTGTHQNKIKRQIFPQSILFNAPECLTVLKTIERAITVIQTLGDGIDTARRASPEKFRPLAPVLNPLGHRSPIKEPAPHPPSRVKS